jgi:hypothetical protein
MAVHFDTGLLWVDVEDDFSRARRRQALARVGAWLSRRPGATRILSFDEVVAAAGWTGERRLGLRTIRLAAVTGTVDSRRDFDRGFRPTSGRVRERWQRLDLAQRRGATLPPIDVYLVDGSYFVRDGHHRVSVGLATGQQVIDAYVTEVRTLHRAAGISPAGRHREPLRLGRPERAKANRPCADCCATS